MPCDREPRRTTRPAAPPRVLLVHDDPAFALLMKEVFAWHGCRLRLEAARGVGEALRRLERGAAPGLILIGLPPYRGGDELLAQARFARAGLGVPIIQLVHLRRARDEDRSLAFGADLYLELPLDWDGYRLLVERVRQLLALDQDDEDEVGASAGHLGSS